MVDGGDIWIKELDDGPLARLTFDAGQDWAPRWAPDGETVTFLSDRAGTRSIWSKRADGVGEPEMLMDYERNLPSGFWSPDGEWLVFRVGAAGGANRDILGFRPGVDSAAVPLVATDFAENSPAISPDGRWLAYASDESGLHEVYVRPFPDVNTGRWLVSNGGGRTPLWAHSGRELFFLASDGGFMAAQVETTPSFRVTEIERLFELPPTTSVSVSAGWYDVTSDDQRFLMARQPLGNDGERDVPQLILVKTSSRS